MGAKIVRILLILLAIFIMAYYLPSFYQKSVEKRPYKTMIYFSEVTHDFIIARVGRHAQSAGRNALL